MTVWCRGVVGPILDPYVCSDTSITEYYRGGILEIPSTDISKELVVNKGKSRMDSKLFG